MMTQDVAFVNAAAAFVYDPDWRTTKGHRLHLRITKDDDGTVSAVVLNLPGAGSCGDTEADAIANAKEATIGVIESYRADGGSIPWTDTTAIEAEPGAKDKWVYLDA